MSGRSSRYQRVGVIASGGMATVYLGRAHGAGGFERPVAIKVMHPHIAKDPEFVTMFLDEARLAARIRHANVVPTVDVESDESGVFLIMEYVDGMSLHRLAKTFRASKVPLPVPIVLRIMVDALAGLHAAHELRSQDGAPLMLVHRDVSPQNILVGTDGVARLTDFGVARAESRLAAATKTGQVKGKTAYMSSEQLRSKPVDRRSDIYSAAVVLWELLAGERLFHGDSEGAVALAAAEGATRPPSEVCASPPAALDPVVMKGLAKDPANRYPTAAAFAEALEDVALSIGLRVGKPRLVSLLLREDPEAGPDELPAACHKVVKALRTEVATAFANAHAALPNHVPGEEVTSRPTDKLALPSFSELSSPKLEQPPSSPMTSAGAVLSQPITEPRRSRAWLAAPVVVLGVAIVAAYYVGTSRGRSDAAPAAAAPTVQVSASSSPPPATPTVATTPEPVPNASSEPTASTPAHSAASSEQPAASASAKVKPTRPVPPPSTAFRPRVL